MNTIQRLLAASRVEASSSAAAPGKDRSRSPRRYLADDEEEVVLPAEKVVLLPSWLKKAAEAPKAEEAPKKKPWSQPPEWAVPKKKP